MAFNKKMIQGSIKTFLQTMGAPDEALRGIDMVFSITWNKPIKATTNDLTAMQLDMPRHDNLIFIGQDESGNPVRLFLQTAPGALPAEALKMITDMVGAQ